MDGFGLRFRGASAGAFCGRLSCPHPAQGPAGSSLERLGEAGEPTRARIRSRVEHVFGAQPTRAGRVFVRTIGLARATVKIGLMNLAYNMARLGFLMRARG